MEILAHELSFTRGKGGDVATELGFDGEVLNLAVTAKSPVELTTCSVSLSHDFCRSSRILVNGYQSWTRTWEHGPRKRMWDLSFVPAPIIDYFALDAMGDYRFTEHANRPGCFHGFSYATVRDSKKSDEITLVGSLDESDGFTLIRIDANKGTVTLQKECPARELREGEHVTLCRYAVITGRPDEVYSRYMELAGINRRPALPLCGYTSWYRHYDAIDEEKLIDDLASTTTVLEEIDTSGTQPVFQIDDGWCKVGDWLHIDAEKFPHGLSPLAHVIKGQGLLAGLWMAPFVCERESRVAQEHPTWLLRDERGSAIKTGSHWSGGLALDTLNPAVRAYVKEVIGTAVDTWGFGLLKLDFLYAACMLPHGGLNRGELMEDAMNLLREATGPDCLILACGVPLANAFGKVEYCRIGCDVGPDWNDKPHMRPLHSERVSTKHSIGNTQSRAPLNQRAFLNDPDVCFLNSDVQLNGNQRELLIATAERHAGMLLTSDDMLKWTSRKRRRYERAIREIAERCSS